MYNSVTNVSIKDKNIKFSPVKYEKYDKYIRPLIFVYHRTKIVYMKQRDKFVTEMIVNITIFNC